MSNKIIRTTNTNVPYYWSENKAARSGNGQFSTDGQTLFSYNMPIGKTVKGEKILCDYTASAGNFISSTTSQHVGVAKRKAFSCNITVVDLVASFCENY